MAEVSKRKEDAVTHLLRPADEIAQIDFKKLRDDYKAEEAAREKAYRERPCGNCGKPWSQHVRVHQGFGMHTIIGGPAPSPIATLCPGVVFIEMQPRLHTDSESEKP
jgi:hypothetical protein